MGRYALAAMLALGALSADVALAKDPAAKHERPSLPVGSIPDDELGKDLKGNKIRISDYHGRVVIVSFWASWCGPCRQELPLLAGVVKQVGLEQLQVIAINYRDDPEPFKYVVKVLKDLPITILRDPNGKTARKYDVQGIPRMIIIGRDGKVAADHTGYGESMIPELVDQLNELLAEKI